MSGSSIWITLTLGGGSSNTPGVDRAASRIISIASVGGVASGPTSYLNVPPKYDVGWVRTIVKPAVVAGSAPLEPALPSIQEISGAVVIAELYEKGSVSPTAG